MRLLEEALRAMQAERFGASRERLEEAPGQSLLFNEAEVRAELAEAQGDDAPLTATPLREHKPTSATKPGRRALAKHLPRRTVRHELRADERICTCCATLTEIGTEVSEQLDYVPAKIEVIEHESDRGHRLKNVRRKSYVIAESCAARSPATQNRSAEKCASPANGCR